jgi:hypothetical protein
MMSQNELARRRRQIQHRIRVALVQRRVTTLGLRRPDSADTAEPAAEGPGTVPDPGDLDSLAA